MDNKVSFVFPENYNRNHPLVIDPEVVVATLSGSQTNESFSHSATFDLSGNIYVAAISFGPGYPTTIGAFQTNFGDGLSNIAISKYNQDGSNLVYATYIGGSNKDLPLSIITDSNKQLYILGVTKSDDYPVTGSSIQPSFGGNTDITITILNNLGANLIGSTFIGGSEVDGVNQAQMNASYGDMYRSEIILDRFSNIYVSSVTSSDDFPVTNNAFDQSYDTIGTIEPNGAISPAQDGVVFKLSNDLTSLNWASYLGDEGADVAMGIRVNKTGQVYVAGTAGGPNFPASFSDSYSSFNGGDADAFLVKIAADGSSILNGTFFGTSETDSGHLIDMDETGNIHLIGLTTGSIQPTPPGVFQTTADSRQFITAFDENLSEVIYTTTIGKGPLSNFSGPFTDFDFVINAFAIDKCNNIHFSGYDAINNLPLTSDNFSTIGTTFYFGILEPNATDLTFASYYGAATHNDGGISRYDKGGTLYQAMCSCTNFSLNTTSNAWAQTQEERCDVGVVKIDFELNSVTAYGEVTSENTTGEVPLMVDFNYIGKNGTTLFWDFGNGETSSLASPSTLFSDPGIYEVMIVATNENTCNMQDTSYLVINALAEGSTNIDEIHQVSEFSILPNPNDGTFNISLKGQPELEVTIEIIDPLGNLISNQKVNFSSGTLNERIVIRNGSPGFYFVNVESSLWSLTEKVVVGKF